MIKCRVVINLYDVTHQYLWHKIFSLSFFHFLNLDMEEARLLFKEKLNMNCYIYL